jgi:phosphoglycolate phosphatase
MTIERQSPSHIIWDWNGSLLNDAWLCVEVMNTMLAEHHLHPITLERYREIFDFPVKDYYYKLGFDFKSESFEVVGMDFMIRYNERQSEASLHSGVREVLAAVAEKGLPQSVLSAREENELRSEIRELGLDKYFTKVYGLDDHYAHGKTDVGIRLMKDLGLPREDYLFIGDTLHDAAVAGELGIRCMLVPNGHQSRERLLTAGVPVISSLPEILNLL